jgi:hypothetical protein
MSEGDATTMPPSSVFQLPWALITGCHVAPRGASGADAAGIEAP